jgi:transposase InsO family protein
MPAPAYVEPPEGDPANVLVVFPLDPIFSVFVSASRHPIIEVLRRPIEFTQYAAHAYQNVLHQHDIVCSMSRKADCWDNAVVESFFARLKTELLHRQSWRTGREVRDAVARYIEGWYNPHRLHSSLGYLSPNQFEQRYFSNQAQAA